MTITACRSCGAKIFWAVTIKGKAMPVDAEPTPNGNLVVSVGDPREAPTVRYATTSDRALIHWTSHFATCVSASSWRKP